MKGLLVRVGADQSEGGGHYNGPVDSRTGEFAYVPIPETASIRQQLAKPYSLISSALARIGLSLPPHLAGENMHLDPDFDYLTYGDQGQRAVQITSKLGVGDLLIFYAALADINSNPRLVYAIIGAYVIDSIVPASTIQRQNWDENAHTRRVLSMTASDIVVRAKSSLSGRLEKCLPIGSFRCPAGKPTRRPCYRVESSVLKAWGGLTVADGFLQRSARLPEFVDAAQFYLWFTSQRPKLIPRNN